MDSLVIFDENDLNNSSRYVSFGDVKSTGKINISFSHLNGSGGWIEISEKEAKVLVKYLSEKFGLNIKETV